MTRESKTPAIQISRWQTTLKWVIILIFAAGALFARVESRLNALEKERDDWKNALTKLEGKIDKLDGKLDDLHQVVPLMEQHMKNDQVLKPTDVSRK